MKPKEKILTIFKYEYIAQYQVVNYSIINNILVLDMKDKQFKETYHYFNINGNFNIPKVINKLLCSNKKIEIELGLNLLNEKY
jgi:hypothetical protein